MALSVFVGSISQKTTTGSQAYTGVGFQPKAIIFFLGNPTADGSVATAARCIGFAAGASSEVGTSMTYNDNSASSATNREGVSTSCIILATSADTVTAGADLTSFDTDGFTLNWSTTDGTARKIFYIAIGGTDLTNAKAATITPAASTGNQAFTGVGFQPDLVLMTAISSTIPAFGNMNQNFMMFKSTSQRAVNATSGSTGVNPGRTRRYQRTDKALVGINSGSDSVAQEGDLVSMDSDGFTINFGTAGNTNPFFYLALKGGQFKIGSFNQKTSTGTDSVSGVGFQPTGLLLLTMANVSTTSFVAASRMGIGAGSGASNVGSHNFLAADNVSPTVASTNIDSAKIIKMMTAGGASPTTQAEAGLTSLDSDGFTLDWTTADATAREVIYLAMGSNAAPAVTTSSIFQTTNTRFFGF